MILLAIQKSLARVIVIDEARHKFETAGLLSALFLA